MALLEVVDISKTFPGVRALDEVSFRGSASANSSRSSAPPAAGIQPERYRLTSTRFQKTRSKTIIAK